jgi:hypothetical protein
MKNSQGSGTEQSGPRPSLGERIKNFFRKETVRDFLLISLAGLVISSVITLPTRPITPVSLGGDNSYYFKNAQSFQKVWKSPFYYFPGLIFDSLSSNELQDIGFNHTSDIDSFQRAPVYIAYLSLWTVLFGESGASLCMSQNFLFALILGMIYLILRLFVSRKAAFAGPVIALTYIFFYMEALLTLTEFFQTLNFLALLYCLQKAYEAKERRRGSYILVALMTVLLVFNKSGLKYVYFLVLPFAIITEFISNPVRKKAANNSILLLVSFFVLLLFGNLILSRGEAPTAASNTLAWRNFYAGACVQADGFGVNTSFHNAEFRKNITAGKDPFWFNRYSEICKPATIEIIKKNPVAYASMTLKKIGVQIVNGSYGYESAYQKLNRGFNTYHILLLVLFIMSFFILPGKETFLLKGLTCLFLAYNAAVYGLSNPDPRYFMPFVPIYIISIVILFKEILIQKLLINLKFWVMLGLLAVSAILSDKYILIALTPNMNFIIVLQFALLIFCVVMFFILMRPQLKDPLYKIFDIGILAAVFLLFLPWIFDNRELSRFELKNTEIRQQIVLPKLDMKNVESTMVAVSLKALSTNAVISMRFNGLSFTNVRVADARYTIVSNLYTRDNMPLLSPGWIYIPIPKDKISTNNEISVYGKNVALYKVYPEKHPKIPSFFAFRGSGAIYGPYNTRDKRLYLDRDPLSSLRTSYVKGRKIKSDIDVYIVVKVKGDYYIPKIYNQLNNAIVKLIALYDPLDSKLVAWSTTDPGPAFEKVSGNLYRYLAGELDRFRSGFIMF